ncbi:ABC transporter ATP-binding protein [Candidatus Sumerlaeota bacterium]|nr:ABC transporter ATP-binding protein [Candidatus Sumerlaeota bacterium]
MAIVAQTTHVSKVYKLAAAEVVALDEVNIVVNEGDFLALMGPSGSGKSTLLHLIAGIDRPSSGTCSVLNFNLGTMSESELAKWRNQYVGFVFQSFNLVPVLSALENVELPLLLTGLSSSKRKAQAKTALELVGLADRMDHTPRQLSGGQQQRIAIARAIATDPQLILCDEPTGNLDSVSADAVLEIFHTLNTQLGKTIIMVTHDPHAARAAKEVRYLEKGKLLPAGEKPKDW